MRNKEKVRVLGPRYNVTCRGSWLNKVDFCSLIYGRDKSELKKMYYKLPWVKNAYKNYYIEAYEEKL